MEKVESYSDQRVEESKEIRFDRFCSLDDVMQFYDRHSFLRAVDSPYAFASATTWPFRLLELINATATCKLATLLFEIEQSLCAERWKVIRCHYRIPVTGIRPGESLDSEFCEVIIFIVISCWFLGNLGNGT